MRFFSRTRITNQNPLLLVSGFWLKAYIALDSFSKLLTSPFRDKEHQGVTIPAWIKRIGAFAIDILAACAIIIIVMELSGMLASSHLLGVNQLLIALGIAFITPVIYMLVAHTAFKSSLGKFVFGLSVRSTAKIGVACSQGLDPNEGVKVYAAATRLQMFAREIFKIGLMPLAPLIVLVAIFSPRSRTLQDILANTVVVYRDKLD